MNEEKMTKDPEIQAREAEIAETRERLASEVDELKDRVSPDNVAHAAKEKAKDMAQDAKEAAKDGVKRAARQTKDKAQGAAIQVRDGAREMAGDVRIGMRRGAFDLGRAVRDNPVPSALTALGIGYIVYQAISDDGYEDYGYRETFTGYDEPGEYEAAYGVPLYRQRQGAAVPHRPASSGDDGSRQRERVREAGHRAKEGASELADRALEGGHYAARRARRGGRKARRKTSNAFDSQPMIFGLGAFVAGLAVGAMVPGTDREDELMGEQRDRLMREARSRAEEAGEVAKEAARKAKDHVEHELPSGEERASKGNGSSTSSTLA